MKTTAQWWAEVSTDQTKMTDWLKDQYHGEATAAKRIRGLLDQYPDMHDRDRKLIARIADDEEKHAGWVKGLLESRGIPAEILEKEERYWDAVLPSQPVSFQRMCAIGYHAESMRLDRIDLLAQDSTYGDIAEVFYRILPDEYFHQMAFRVMSTPEDIAATAKNHADGKNALGLIA